ncbi:hypothetical protein BDV36DRAFT_245558 [Aspergillus pseudocaelatus]|uniref:Uncharacterized protein n=1 Tax=Aspergillus pseudocaelatus TaxID=1825620 RepID=A0ABQ6X0F5_9EURO|nr:hypothetical protein BDV36DRAFT_245558 [Aspergillus pseudocaelatus]
MLSSGREFAYVVFHGNRSHYPDSKCSKKLGCKLFCSASPHFFFFFLSLFSFLFLLFFFCPG